MFSSLKDISFDKFKSSATENIAKAKSGASNLWQMMSAPDPPAAHSEELGIYYVTDNMLAMGFPSEASALSGTGLDDVLQRHEKLNRFLNESHINKVANFLEKYHQGRYMIWNISEKKYDYTLFQNQVIEVNFPGYPAPPLEQMMQLCTSIHGWLQADPENVAVVHCQTGKGRTVTTVAGYLAWSGVHNSPADSLRSTVQAMHGTVKTLTLPSQTRYLAYLQRMLNEKIPPSARSVKIHQISLKTIPNLETSPEEMAENPVGGCRPYVQVFKNAKLLYTSKKKNRPVPRCTIDQERVDFPMDLEIDGDILIRLRHEAPSGERITMLRLAFHTGYLDHKAVITFKRSQLDGAWNNDAFDKDFALEMRVRFSTEPAKDQAQSEEFWRIVNTKHDQSQRDAIPEMVFHIGEEEEISDSEDDEEELLNASEQQKRNEELRNTSDLLGDTGKNSEKDSEFADLEKYVAGLNMDDAGSDSDVDPNMAAMFDQLAEEDNDDNMAAMFDQLAEQLSDDEEDKAEKDLNDLDIFGDMEKAESKEVVKTDPDNPFELP